MNDSPKLPVLLGNRDIRPGDFSLEDDAKSILDDGVCFALTAECNVDELFGTHVETADNDDWLEMYFTVSEDLIACNPDLLVILHREDGNEEPYVHPLTEAEADTLLTLCRKYEANRLQNLIDNHNIALIEDGHAAWRKPA